MTAARCGGGGGGGGGGRGVEFGGGAAASAAAAMPPPPVVSIEEAHARDHLLICEELTRLRRRTNWVLRMMEEPLLVDCVRADDAAVNAAAGQRRCDLCRFLLDYLMVQSDTERGSAPLRTLPDVERIVRSAVRAHDKCAMLYVVFVALALQRESIVPMLTRIDPVTGTPSVASHAALDAYCGKLYAVLTSQTLPMSQHRVRGGMNVFLTHIDTARLGGGGGGDSDDPFAGLFLSTTACTPGSAADEARHGQAMQTPLEFICEAQRLALEIFPNDAEAGWPPALAVPAWDWYVRLLENVRARAPNMPLHVAILRLGEYAARRVAEAGEPQGTTFLPDPVAIVG